MTILNAVHAGESIAIAQDTFFQTADGAIRSACKLVTIPGMPIVMGGTGSVKAYHHLVTVVQNLIRNGRSITEIVNAVPTAWKMIKTINPANSGDEVIRFVLAAYDPETDALKAWAWLSDGGFVTTEIEPKFYAFSPAELDTEAADFPTLYALGQQAVNGEEIDAYMIALAKNQRAQQVAGKLNINSGIGGRLVVAELSKAGVVFRDHVAFEGDALANEPIGALFGVDDDHGGESDQGKPSKRSYAVNIATLKQPLDMSQVQHRQGC